MDRRLGHYRRIKVEDLQGTWEQNCRNAKPKPLIRLKGSWLERAGFRPGDHVEVEVRAYELVIRLDK